MFGFWRRLYQKKSYRRVGARTSHEGALSSKFSGTDPVAPEIMFPTLLPRPENGLKDMHSLLGVLVLVLVLVGDVVLDGLPLLETTTATKALAICEQYLTVNRLIE